MERGMAGGRTRALFPYLYRRGASASVWLVACGALLGVLLSPEIMKYLARLRSSSVEPGDGEESIAWELVENSGGFRTFSSRVQGSSSLALRGETTVDEHIGRL
ncbi:unnamed protein product, partial [Ectocarpus sp. 8 AP-2014]